VVTRLRVVRAEDRVQFPVGADPLRLSTTSRPTVGAPIHGLRGAVHLAGGVELTT
jgi:hypothetical protein